MINFHRHNFFPKKNETNLKSLCLLIDNLLVDYKMENNFIIENISSPENIFPNSIIFIDHLIDHRYQDLNLCIITNNKLNLDKKIHNVFFVKDLNKSYNLIINHLYHHEDCLSYSDSFDYDNGSYLSKFASIDKSARIGKNCVIGRGVEIGKDSIIKNNVVIKNSIIGSNVIICDNTSIGTTGFGFDINTRGSNNLNPQIGIVYIGDNCHIGSSCTIDRGKIDFTYIGNNCMIDNLVHIAHNVILSDNACIAAQTGISGSVKIGVNATIGGQVGFAGHIKIGNNVVVAAKSGVTKNIYDNSTVAGFPATDIKEWKKKIIKERRNGYK